MKSIIFILSLLVSFLANSQQLERKAFFGIQLQPVSAELAQANNLSEGKGVLANNVIPNSTAEKANIKKGDILLEINGTELTNPNQTVTLVRGLREGDKLDFKLIREGKIITGSAKAQAMAQENYPGLVVNYGSVKSGNNLLRTITIIPPKPDKKPAVFYIQGVGCYSIDSPLDTNRNEILFLRNLARAGYAILRVEKPGVGDSKGGPCENIDFYEELAGYVSALKEFKKSPEIDTNNIFIFGHSMGGVMAPLVAKRSNVKGIIAYGTIGTNFMEYFINSRRNITEAQDMNPVEADNYIKQQNECMSLLIAHRMKKEEALKYNENCGQLYDDITMRSFQFWYDLYDLNIPEIYKNYKGKVLAVWGESDFVSTRQEHEKIIDAVNYYNKGNGKLITIPDASHGMEVAVSFKDAADADKRPLNPRITTEIINWLNSL